MTRLDDNYVGVEIEMENRARFVPSDVFDKYWRREEDGSLRNGGMEVVFRNPYKGKDVVEALTAAEKATAKCIFSFRCGLHVHIDCRDLTSAQLRSFVMLYVLFEPVIMPLCGDGREESNFCVPVGYNTGLLDALGSRASIQSIAGRGRDDFGRYSALNLQAFLRYGSLEFRAMQGTGNAQEILDWINILLCLKEYGKTRPKLREMLVGASDGAPHELMGAVFDQELSEKIFSVAGAEFNTRLVQGARNLQYVLHTRKNTSINALLGRVKKGDGGEAVAAEGKPDEWAFYHNPEEVELRVNAAAQYRNQIIDDFAAGPAPAPPEGVEVNRPRHDDRLDDHLRQVRELIRQRENQL